MLEWHDCRTDPPKKSGPYVLICDRKKLKIKFWMQGWYDAEQKIGLILTIT